MALGVDNYSHMILENHVYWPSVGNQGRRHLLYMVGLCKSQFAHNPRLEFTFIFMLMIAIWLMPK